MHSHQLTPCLSTLGRRDASLLFRVGFPFVAQSFPQVCVDLTQLIQHEDPGRLEVSPDGLKSLGLILDLAFKADFLAEGIASPQGEVI